MFLVTGVGSDPSSYDHILVAEWHLLVVSFAFPFLSGMHIYAVSASIWASTVPYRSEFKTTRFHHRRFRGTPIKSGVSCFQSCVVWTDEPTARLISSALVLSITPFVGPTFSEGCESTITASDIKGGGRHDENTEVANADSPFATLVYWKVEEIII
jgi:hypothetical protein